MTLTTTLADDARNTALLKAIGFDRLSPEQRELALGIANRYGLDPMLKHLVMIEGRAYITRDGLLHVAHKDGAFDGMVTTEPVLADGFWRSTCSVYRKDMSHPFTYTGRYPEAGKNKAFAPEMAVKVGEVMALRRAFDIAAPAYEERWDVAEATVDPVPPPVSLAEKVAAKAERVRPDPPVSDETVLKAEKLTETAADPPDASLTAIVASGAPDASEPMYEGKPIGSETTLSGLTVDEFVAALKDVDRDRVKRHAKDLFPGMTKFADLTPNQRQMIVDSVAFEDADIAREAAEDETGGPDQVSDPTPTTNAAGITLCGAHSPLSDAVCTLDADHPGRIHRAGASESWEEGAKL